MQDFPIKKEAIIENNKNDYINTVDGQNPATPRMMIIPLFIGF